MAALNYAKRLENLKSRKFDRELNESLFSKSASANLLPEKTKYLVESMRPIEQRYNERTFDAASRVQKHLQDGFRLHFNRAYRTQGSVKTGTNIKVHSDFDLLAIVDAYHFPETPPSAPYTASDPNEDIKEMRTQATAILKSVYDEVDDKGEKSISVLNKSLNRRVDIVFSFWFHPQKYEETKNEYYKGIYLFKFPTKTKVKDFPFATIHNVNCKGDNTGDGSRRGIRLLKNLKADSETQINLSSFQLTTIVHSIADNSLHYAPGSELQIAKVVSAEMDKLIKNPIYRKAVKSPNAIGNPLAEDETVPHIKTLKEDLDTLIQDSEKEVSGNFIIKQAMITY